MRKINKYIIGVALMMGVLSCNDLLEEEPRDRINVNNYFENMASFDAVITAAYGQLTANNWDRSLGSARVRSLFCGADDWTTQPGGNKYDWKQADLLAVSSGDNGILDNGWALAYDVILQANFAIDNIQTIYKLGEDLKVVNAHASEAYFLRAWGYFWLVRLFGGVPIITTPEVTNEKLQLPRSSVLEVYTQILSDLEFAIEHLPEAQPQYGRVDRWAAKTMRSKVYLTMAGWPLKQTDKYALALSDAEDIIQNGPFALEPVFSDIFSLENEETNTEYIWQIPYCGINECEQARTSPFVAITTKPAELGGFQDLFIERAFFNKYPEGARKEFTFLDTLYSQTGAVIPWQNFIWKHPFLSKFYSGSVDKYAPFETQVGAPTAGLDIPLYRITEVYMIYAEAQVMGGGGNAATALEYVNKIRRRAKGVDMNVADTDDLTSLTLDIIIEERGWEFVGEMKRWFDLIRTEKLAEALSDRDEPDNMSLIGDPSNKNLYYHPIPDVEIGLNPNLTQNPR